ncbi:MAG: hypothetical protein J6V76_01105 [Bacteroidales bacterium]|nr:hypothetical protein [Bacteroidales bacterium]
MENKLYTKQEVIDFINNGRVMSLTGSEKALSGLPKGNWIGGTSYYIVDTIGKEASDDLIFVDDFTLVAQNCKMIAYDETNIQDIAKNGYKNGFVVVVLPIDSQVYYTFANNALRYENMFDNPVVGYIAATKMEDYGKKSPQTATGIDGKLTNSLASVLYVELPDYLSARAEIENFDTIDPKSPKIVFPKDGFVQSDCTIDGKSGNIADYFENVIKPRLGGYTQMITSQNGALINRDIKIVDSQKGEVTFFSPVYAGDEYYLVDSSADYLSMFNRSLGSKRCDVLTCFSCISYFFGGKFEGKNVCKNGIYAFGEIGYQLLNKTVVTLEIDKVK